MSAEPSLRRAQQAVHQFLVRQKEARNWVSAVFQQEMPHNTEDFQELLSDGVLLCKLINEIVPGCIPNTVVVLQYRHAEHRKPNIEVFLQACR